jgi:5-methylcytosine-specific restriction endonuclease McrA
MPKSVNARRRRKLPRAVFATLAAKQGNRCGMCGQAMRAAGVHIDHIVPLAHGGLDALWNLRLVHRCCNLIRGTKA